MRSHKLTELKKQKNLEDGRVCRGLKWENEEDEKVGIGDSRPDSQARKYKVWNLSNFENFGLAESFVP